MLDLDATQQATLKALVGRLADVTATVLDPSDPATRAAIQLMLEIGNKTAERYPALHAALAGGQMASGAPTEAPTVVDLGQDRGGRATSRTWIGTEGMPLMSGATTVVLDARTGAVLAHGAATIVGEGLVRVGTDTASAQPAAPVQTALTLYHSQATAAGPPRFGAIARTLATEPIGNTPSLSQPILSIPGHTNWVKIGLNRPNPPNPNDCEYWYIENAPIDDPPLIVPFVGSLTLPYPIRNIQPDGTINGLGIGSTIYVSCSTGNQITPQNPALLPAHITASPSAPSTINWNFPWDKNNTSTSIVYGAARNALDVMSAFYFGFTVPVTGPNPYYSFALCSYDTPTQPSTICFPMANVMFTWHCLAEDTVVTRDDGTPIRIDAVDNSVRLRTAIGDGALGVEGTWFSKHTGEAVRLTTARGQQLTATVRHPIFTPRGLVAAGDLRVGDRVIGAAGAALELTAVDRVAYTGRMWNLELGNAADRADAFTGEAMPGTFLANGIAVGDVNAQGRLYRSTRRSFDYMAARIPTSHHRDYQSALEDIAGR